MIRKFEAEPFSDETKNEFVKTISEILNIQLIPVGDITLETSSGINKKAVGYVYGFTDAALTCIGQDMSNMSLGVPIAWQIFRKLFPGKEDQCIELLADTLDNDTEIMRGVMYGGQQYMDYINEKLTPMGLAKCILEKSSDT